MSLAVIKTEKQEVNESAVEVLEELLADAKKGEIESVVIVTFGPDHSFRSLSSKFVDGMRKLGAIETIKADMLADMRRE